MWYKHVTLHDFKAREEDELSFQKGKIMYIMDTDHYKHWSVMEKVVSFLLRPHKWYKHGGCDTVRLQG